MSESNLTDEAKAAIAEAVRIVREDRFESFLREKLGGKTPENAGQPGGPPPAKDPAPPVDDKPKRGLWWGDSLNDEK